MTEAEQAPRSVMDDKEDLGAELMFRVKDGDPEAFAALVSRYQRTVLNVVFRYIGNRAIAEELTQDVFVRVYRARETYERKAKFETWLYRIVFNLCVNASEYGKRRRAASLDEVSPEGERRSAAVTDPGSTTPLEEVEREEMRTRVQEAIEQLPEQQRAALIMSRYQGMQYQQVAEALNTSEEAIKSLLFRARDNLRQRLEPFMRGGEGDEL